MNKKDTQYFKIKLEKERKLLEDELATIGQVDTDRKNGWEATTKQMEVDSADENEVADKMEELEENELIVGQLKPQLKEVSEALDRINRGTYGKCEVCGEVIEKERLEANPSAKKCMKHMK